jgi:enterochelin esterase-like enzyme/sugar lactone lactonase YvrE
MRNPLLALLCAAFCIALPSCAQYTPGPDSKVQPNVPKGTVTRAVLPPGKFYPGTPHSYQVYVPAQYDPKKPAPLLVYLDGNGPTVVLDNLIAKGDIPPMIGIFVAPGVLAPPNDDAMGRYNRIFEYDNISGRFADFLEQELIPEVAKKYNISKNPDDRAIGGVSTGAVGAFVAAWERPDMFHRVLTWIGTFVDMKGSDSLAAMVRRTEPKPLRVWLQDGKNDHITPDQPFGVFYAGSWPLNNQVMYEALEFGGYDVKLTIGEGGHDGNQSAALMPDAIRWIWRDYPAPIVAKPPAALDKKGWEPRGQVYSVLIPGKSWEPVAGAYQSVSSPAVDKEGNVYFADSVAGKVYKCDAEGKVSVFRDNTGGANVIRFGADGRLYASQPGRKRIVSWGADEKVVATNAVAADMAFTSKNALYFINALDGSVNVIGADGKRRIALPAGEIAKPTTLTFSPDQSLIDVGDAATKFNWSYQLSAEGTMVYGEPFYRVDIPETATGSSTSGSAVDTLGQAYWATGLGIQFCEQNGRCAGILSKPERGNLGNFVFGGKDLNWLYVAEGDKLYRRETKSKGVAAWSPVKPPRPPL